MAISADAGSASGRDFCFLRHPKRLRSLVADVAAISPTREEGNLVLQRSQGGAVNPNIDVSRLLGTVLTMQGALSSVMLAGFIYLLRQAKRRLDEAHVALTNAQGGDPAEFAKECDNLREQAGAAGAVLVAGRLSLSILVIVSAVELVLAVYTHAKLEVLLQVYSFAFAVSSCIALWPPFSGLMK